PEELVDPTDASADTVAAQPPQQSANALVRQVKRRPWRLGGMEEHWYECLLYPLRAWPLVLGLAIVLTALSGGAALAVPSMLSDLRAESSWLLWVCLPWLPALLIL